MRDVQSIKCFNRGFLPFMFSFPEYMSAAYRFSRITVLTPPRYCSSSSSRMHNNTLLDPKFCRIKMVNKCSLINGRYMETERSATGQDRLLITTFEEIDLIDSNYKVNGLANLSDGAHSSDEKVDISYKENTNSYDNVESNYYTGRNCDSFDDECGGERRNSTRCSRSSSEDKIPPIEYVDVVPCLPVKVNLEACRKLCLDYTGRQFFSGFSHHDRKYYSLDVQHLHSNSFFDFVFDDRIPRVTERIRVTTDGEHRQIRSVCRLTGVNVSYCKSALKSGDFVVGTGHHLITEAFQKHTGYVANMSYDYFTDLCATDGESNYIYI